MSFFSNIRQQDLDRGRAHYADLIKVLFCQENVSLLEKLDIENDDIFLDPYVYAYFSSNESDKKVTLEQIVFGHIAPVIRPSAIPIIFDGATTADPLSADCGPVLHSVARGCVIL